MTVEIALSVGRLVVALVLVAMNGFFVASEFAFVRVRSTAVEQLVAEGRPGAGTLQEVMDNLDDYLAATQLGITVASLGLGWAGEPAIVTLIEPVLGPLLPDGVVHLVAFAIGFSTVTFLHVVFGELAPKTIAIAQAERIAMLVAPPMKISYYLFYPGLVLFNGTANGFTRMLGFPPASESEETLEEREIRRVLSRSSEQGTVDEGEVEMIERVFELDDTLVREVMIPRPDVVTLADDATPEEIRSTVRETGHTRYPVLGTGDDEEIVGFLDVKDVLDVDDGDAVTAADLARDVTVVPETTTIDDLLVAFRERHQQMAVIVDEWGALEGIATVEDVVEAVVGDLRDEFDAPEYEPTIREREDGTYEVDGGVPLRDLNADLGTELESEGFDTVGGFILDHLARAPEPGDRIESEGVALEVVSVNGTRISTVLIEWLDGDLSPEDEEDDSPA